MAQVQRSRRSRNARSCARRGLRTYSEDNEARLEIFRQRPRQAGPRAGRAPRRRRPASGRAARRRALHRAPRGRGREGEYYLLCLEHVRQFNASYNYFAGHEQRRGRGLPEGQRHRPPSHLEGGRQCLGARHAPRHGRHARSYGRRFSDPHEFFSWRCGATPARRRRDALKPLELKALESLDLTATAPTGDEIKARFKELVKRHHPDANGGDKRSEDKLREIIQAYNYLKQAGLV